MRSACCINDAPEEWESPDAWADEPPPDVTGECGVFRRYFEIRLGIAPVGASSKIDLVFAQRCVDELWDEHKCRAYRPTYFFPEHWPANGWGGGDAFKNLNRPVGLFATDMDAWEERGPLSAHVRFNTTCKDLIPPCELSDVTNTSVADSSYDPTLQDLIEEVDPRTCRKYLGRDLQQVDCSLQGEFRTALHSPAGTIAARVEANLYSDSDRIEDADRLDTLMMREVEHRCLLLATCIERQRNLALDNERKLFYRWGFKD
jgi:hypothetical protein